MSCNILETRNELSRKELYSGPRRRNIRKEREGEREREIRIASSPAPPIFRSCRVYARGRGRTWPSRTASDRPPQWTVFRSACAIDTRSLALSVDHSSSRYLATPRTQVRSPVLRKVFRDGSASRARSTVTRVTPSVSVLRFVFPAVVVHFLSSSGRNFNDNLDFAPILNVDHRGCKRVSSPPPFSGVRIEGESLLCLHANVSFCMKHLCKTIIISGNRRDYSPTANGEQPLRSWSSNERIIRDNWRSL